MTVYLKLLVKLFKIHFLIFFCLLICCLVTDRKKDLVKLQAGEYVSLGKVEAELKTCPIVENICVYCDSTKQFTVALVVPNQKHLEELAVKHGITGEFEELCSSPVLEKAVIKELAEHGVKCEFFLYFCVFLNIHSL